MNVHVEVSSLIPHTNTHELTRQYRDIRQLRTNRHVSESQRMSLIHTHTHRMLINGQQACPALSAHIVSRLPCRLTISLLVEHGLAIHAEAVGYILKATVRVWWARVLLLHQHVSLNVIKMPHILSCRRQCHHVWRHPHTWHVVAK